MGTIEEALADSHWSRFSEARSADNQPTKSSLKLPAAEKEKSWPSTEKSSAGLAGAGTLP
jgi:hypothetical protein